MPFYVKFLCLSYCFHSRLLLNVRLLTVRRVENQLSPRSPVSNYIETHPFRSHEECGLHVGQSIAWLLITRSFDWKESSFEIVTKRAGGRYNLITLMVASPSRIQKGENPIAEFSWTVD